MSRPTAEDLVTEAATFAGVATRVVRSPLDGPPTFLLLHGFSDSADGWRRLQTRLADAGHGSVAVDQPSHGRADALDPDRPVVEQFVAFAADAVRQLGDGPMVVVGNSLGGAHALLVAQHHPDLVRGVVAISPASFEHPSWFRVLDQIRHGGRPSARARRLVPPRRVRRAIAAPAMRTVAFGRPWLAPSWFLDEWRANWQVPERANALRALVPRVRDEYIAVDPIHLDAIRQPVLALWGTRDRLVLIKSRDRLQAGLADLEFVPLPGVGHMPQLETPGRTTKHLLAFVDRLGAGAASS